MKTKQMIADINMMLDAFADNSFLIPSTHSDLIVFSNKDGRYKTYCNDSRDYITLGSGSLNISCFKRKEFWQIDGSNLLLNISTGKQIKDAYTLIKDIYDEVHSLNPDKNKVKEIRKKILEEKDNIKKANERINKYRKQIEDFKKLTQ